MCVCAASLLYSQSADVEGSCDQHQPIAGQQMLFQRRGGACAPLALEDGAGEARLSASASSHLLPPLSPSGGGGVQGEDGGEAGAGAASCR